MEREQIDAVYRYVCEFTGNPQTLLDWLNRGTIPWESAANAVLYLPMYSTGRNAEGWTVRIDWLRANEWGVDQLANATAGDREAIATTRLHNGNQFGYRNRICELVCRANQILAHGRENLGVMLAPQANWAARDLILPLQTLKQFRGVGTTAALHILMELGWGVVKPDRHICRFLSRLGGPWIDYFLDPGTAEVDDVAVLLLEETWRDACNQLRVDGGNEPPVRQYDGVQFRDLSTFSPRQIDTLIMLYTQDVPRRDRAWRPQPICTATPQCNGCGVPACAGRRRAAPRGVRH